MCDVEEQGSERRLRLKLLPLVQHLADDADGQQRDGDEEAGNADAETLPGAERGELGAGCGCHSRYDSPRALMRIPQGLWGTELVLLRLARRLLARALPMPRSPEPPAIRRLLPMELQLGDRITDETGEWDVISRPYSSADDKLASVHVRKVGQPDVTEIRTWGTHERVSVRRTGGAEGSAR